MKTINHATKTTLMAIMLFGALALLLRHNGTSSVSAHISNQSSPSAEAAKAGLDNLPLYFLANRGQLDRRVAFYVPGRDQTLYFTPQGITFALNGVKSQPQLTQWNLQLEFVGANPHVKLRGRTEAAAQFNYFVGQPDE